MCDRTHPGGRVIHKAAVKPELDFAQFDGELADSNELQRDTAHVTDTALQRLA